MNLADQCHVPSHFHRTSAQMTHQFIVITSFQPLLRFQSLPSSNFNGWAYSSIDVNLPVDFITKFKCSCELNALNQLLIQFSIKKKHDLNFIKSKRFIVVKLLFQCKLTELIQYFIQFSIEPTSFSTNLNVSLLCNCYFDKKLSNLIDIPFKFQLNRPECHQISTVHCYKIVIQMQINQFDSTFHSIFNRTDFIFNKPKRFILM